jgi:hypothetical protein
VAHITPKSYIILTLFYKHYLPLFYKHTLPLFYKHCYAPSGAIYNCKVTLQFAAYLYDRNYALSKAKFYAIDMMLWSYGRKLRL